MRSRQVVVLTLAVLAGLLTGGAAERWRQTREEGAGRNDRPPAATRGGGAPARPGFQTQSRAAAESEMLRKRVAELERERDALLARLADVASRPAPAGREEPAPADTNGFRRTWRDRPSRVSFEERMEQMRIEQPEAYAEMQRRREDMRQRMEERARERRDFLAAVRTDGMTPAQRDNHERLLATQARIDAYLEMIAAGTPLQMTEETRSDMFETMRVLGELYEQERRYLLEETGRAFGEDGHLFADYIENIYNQTSLTPGRDMLRLLGGGCGGGGRGPPPPPAERPR